MYENYLVLRTERQMIEDKLRETQGLWDIANLSTNVWWSSRQRRGRTKGQKRIEETMAETFPN